MESDQHEANCFITLTYAPTHPKTGKLAPIHLVRKDLKMFKDRLRDHIDYHYKIKIKTFDCGEYGDENYRPHFHMLIFGFDFPDKFKAGESKAGHTIYHSQKLEDLWGHGLCTIQDLTMNAATYCALYQGKPRHELPDHLQAYPEFNTWSKGLGIQPMLDNMDKYLLTDEIYYDGRKHNIPQAVLNKYFTEEERKVGETHHALLSGSGVSERAFQYYQLKMKRIEKARINEEAILAKLASGSVKSVLGQTRTVISHEGNEHILQPVVRFTNNSFYWESLEQRKYRKEQEEKRLTKPL